MNSQQSLILAIDTADLKQAYNIAVKFKNHVAAIKLGLEFFVAHGSAGVKYISQTNIPIFLDLKLHDIPHTVACAVREAVKLNIFMLTLHCAGGIKMLEEAVVTAQESAKEFNFPKITLLGVTILTSLDKADIHQVGYKGEVVDNVLNFANIAQKAQLDGIVCSAYEAKIIKEKFPKLKLIVPGIRFSDDNKADQKRIMTPDQALMEGASFLVMGRSILASDNPLMAIKKYNNLLK
jgi:orotidine-5'-phosphate decarboxylase